MSSPDDSSETPAPLWDEHRWEQLLRESDARTDKYLALFEKYQDHPDCDAIIDREMGWVDDKEDSETSAGEDGMPPIELNEDEMADAAAELARRRVHPLAESAREFVSRLFAVFVHGERPAEEHPAVGALISGASICAAKVRAALGIFGEEMREPGMTIAYLKRGLKALMDGLVSLDACERAGLVRGGQAAELRAQGFAVRGGIIAKMGELRAELRRRQGGT